jgi:glyoxylase-like metal-dependent hydrolase (beta-lactamase superfamily II)
VQEVEDGYQIEPGVTIIHTPGHSPGSISLQVETDQGEALITGDVLHTGGVALSRVNPLVFWNADQAKASIDRIVEIADVIYPGHDRPFRLAKGGVEYLAPQDLVLAGIDLTEPGVRIDLSPRPSWVMPGIEEQRPEDFE